MLDAAGEGSGRVVHSGPAGEVAISSGSRWLESSKTSSDDESSASEEIDVDIVVGPNPSQAVRHIMTQQFQKLVEGSDHEGLRRRAMQGPISTRKKVELSDCQILSRMSSDRQPRSFGTTLHLGVNCTILCQVCSFSGTLRACKKSWLCDFCHALSPQCRNRRKGSGAWQVSQLSQERILELYEALQNTVERGHEDAQVNLPPHPRTIPDPQTRRVWRSEARGAAPHVASRANTWGGEGTDNYDQRHRPQRSQNRQYSYSSWHSEGPQTFAPSLMSRNVQDSQQMLAPQVSLNLEQLRQQEQALQYQLQQLQWQPAVQRNQPWNQLPAVQEVPNMQRQRLQHGFGAPYPPYPTALMGPINREVGWEQHGSLRMPSEHEDQEVSSPPLRFDL